jgi:hypothetical protein
MSYLALLATEYDLQFTSADRATILLASSTDQLQQALTDLTNVTRQINGFRPQQQTMVLSVRDDLLGLAAKGPNNPKPGDPQQTPAQRFASRMWSPELAVYDDAGKYIGQGIRFHFQPQGALLTACDEHLWNVNISPQGDFGIIGSQQIPLALYKSNSFAAQWCAAHGDGSAVQVASTAPSAELLPPEQVHGDDSQRRHYTPARVMAWVNKTRAEFEDPNFTAGQSEELAGRGLYGDYILLFDPRQLPAGFPLDKTEDIYLRFDYLSVANAPDPGIKPIPHPLPTPPHPMPTPLALE